MSIALLLNRSTPGANVSINGHIKRGERIADAINERFGVREPRQWQVKHLRWVLERWAVEQASTTRYDYWRTVRVLASALGKWSDWEPHLRGPWCKDGIGGRRPKLAHTSERMVSVEL